MKRLLTILALLFFGTTSLQAQFSGVLLYATSTTANLGQFVDKADGFTPKTALTPTVYISKNGAPFLARISVGTISHDKDGYYKCPLSTYDTNTVGRLVLEVTDTANHLGVERTFTVLPAASYNWLIGGQVSSTADLWNLATASVTGGIGLQLKTNADGPTSNGWMQTTTIATLASQTSFTLTAGSPNNSSYLNAVAVITSAGDATLKAQATISAYTGSTKTVTLRTDPAIYTMAAGDTITIYADRTPENMMATTFEGTETFKHFLQYGASALFGKYNSSAGVFNFRDLADTKNRIVYTTTATSRATVTLSPD